LPAFSAFVADVAFAALVVVAEVVAEKIFSRYAKACIVSKSEDSILIFICLTYQFDFAHPS